MDLRTRREKIEAMARQSASPNEAEVARTMLAGMGSGPPPPPTRNAGGLDDDSIRRWHQWFRVTISTSNATWQVTYPDFTRND